MKNLSFLLGGFVLFSACTAASAQTVKFADDLKNWKQARLSCEKNDKLLRVNVVAGAKGNNGQIWKYISAVPQGKYLQLKVDSLENADSFGWVHSPSTSVRRPFGIVLQGINTYSPQVKTRFAFAISQTGNKKKNGSWINYDSFTISAAPENSLIAEKTSAADTLKVGDTLNFKIFRAKKCEKPVRIRFFITHQGKRALQNFRLAKTATVDAVYDSKAKCYTASLKITADAYSFDSKTERMYLIAHADLDGVQSYFTMPWHVKLETKNKLPKALFTADSPVTRDNRQAWFDMTWGKKNLALNKPIQFIPRPNYNLTRDKKGHPAKDATDLTDGKLTTRVSDTIWFDRHAVGFYGGYNTVFMRLDLGSVKPVDYIALRALGGSESGFRFPRKLEVFVSRDNKNFYAATEMFKLAPAEAYQSDFVRTYYYPETTKWQQSVCKALKLHVKADARYIIVKLTLDKHFFSDEMAVIAADKKDADFNRAYTGRSLSVPQDTLAVQPRVPELAVIKGVSAPQELIISDFRIDQKKLKQTDVIVELPAELTISEHAAQPVQINGRKYNRYKLPAKKMKLPYFYILSSDKTPDKLPPAYVYVEYDGKTGFKQELPLKLMTLPKFKTFKKIPVCLAWMVTEGISPERLKDHMRFGFNSAGTFPRWWIRNPKADTTKRAKQYEDLRKAGLQIFMNDSAIHEMIRTHKAGSEVYCITEKPSKIVCPSYTGKYYQMEMDRIARCTALSKPHHVLLDIECFNSAFRRSAVECARCREGIKKSGLSTEEYIYSCGKRMMTDISNALKKGAETAGIPMPKLHMYDLDRTDNTYGIVRFTDLYPQLIKSSQPSLYIGGHPAVIQKNIRQDYKLMGNKDIMPWLSTGCYGEYDSHLVEPIVLEALMNGAGGILYFAFNYFADSPLDFYYHALAIMKLAPYEELLIHGKYPAVKGTNDKMLYSAVRHNNEMLLLVGNYYKASPATTVTLPFAQAQILDLNTKKSFTSGREFKMNVKPGKFNLYYIKMR